MENDPWGLPYKIVAKKLSRYAPVVVAAGRENDIADAIFSPRPLVEWKSVPLETDPTDTDPLHSPVKNLISQ